jgi:hypothetical protein
MELLDPGRMGEEEILARHIRLAEVYEGKRLLDWFDLETFIYDASCPTVPGKRVALWSIALMKACLKDAFLVKAQQAPEILTIYPFFALNFLPGANDVPRVYADVFRFALQLSSLKSLERFGGILRALRRSLQAVLWYHTQLQFEVASLAQKAGWHVQLELPYGNGTRNKSDVCLSRGEARYPVEAVTLRLSESGRKKRVYSDRLFNWSIQFGVDIVGRLGEPWSGGAKEERQWVQQAFKTLVSVRNTGLLAIVYSPNGGSLTFSRTMPGKLGRAALNDADSHEDIWDRLRTALSEKNKQASGNLVWLRMGEYAGLWHWSRYREMTLEEKVQSLTPLAQAALESLPHIAGVILSPGIEPDYAPGGHTPGTYSSVDGAIAVRCALPGSCIRESIIIPRREMDADARVFASLYEHEDTWLDWALQQAGHPPFHELVQDR